MLRFADNHNFKVLSLVYHTSEGSASVAPLERKFFPISNATEHSEEVLNMKVENLEIDEIDRDVTEDDADLLVESVDEIVKEDNLP